MSDNSGRSLRPGTGAAAAGTSGPSAAGSAWRAGVRSTTFISGRSLPLSPIPTEAGATMPRRRTGGNRGIRTRGRLPLAVGSSLVSAPALSYRPATLVDLRRAREIAQDLPIRTCPSGLAHEARHPSGVSHHQGGDDRRHRVHHPHDLGQAGRYAPSRHRPEIAPGMDRRPATAGRPRRPALAFPEKVRGPRAQEIAPGLAASNPRAAGFHLATETAGGARFDSLPLEGGPQQAELPFDRIAAVDAGRRRMDRGVEAAHRALQDLGALDQRAQPLGQKLEVRLVARLAGRQLDLGLLLVGLRERHLALLDRPMEQG